MKLLKSKKIQKLVDKRLPGSLQSVCDLCILAYAEVDNLKGHVAHRKGMKDALRLVCKLQELLLTTAHSTLAAYPPEQPGIYTAKQKTSDGKDRFYFIGTVSDICDRISSIEVA